MFWIRRAHKLCKPDEPDKGILITLSNVILLLMNINFIISMGDLIV